ncbi:leucine-rich repeat receptor protein kinase HPCA1-like [Actinidia eriantha]|uniref:leucine-rich repeat receptor protein kinase HPCA1-like n=1 Tax=Actinidia eriantha TaxID=165200 RepID=UPI00258BBCE6|nr:leucine-rich repeat receptor protein kinase HPCA1-like [Actinidia eriantha]
MHNSINKAKSIFNQWQNTPSSWDKSGDPCGAPWEGVTCNNSRVTALGLSAMGLIGKLNGDIGGLTELRSLDLSINRGLTGSLSSRIGDLQKLSILLSKLYWLDLADNQLIGSIPVSTFTSPGLDLLKKAKHFHFNKNQLSGTIPSKLFSSDMVLMHVLFDGNQIRGKIPDTLGLVETLEVLNLAHNNLFGPLPNLAGMNSLSYVDLSNNSVQISKASTWFSNLQSLTTLVIEFGSLQGDLPQKLFSLPQIQQVISQELQLVDLQNNRISTVTLGYEYKNTLILIGNPVCTSALANTEYCQL